MALFDYCGACGACCSDMQDTLTLVLTRDEQRRLGDLRGSTGVCAALANRGCGLDERSRPIFCRLYPLVYCCGGLRLDVRCARALPYLQDLAVRGEANEHLHWAVRMIRRASPSFLRRMSDTWKPLLLSLPLLWHPQACPLNPKP